MLDYRVGWLVENCVLHIQVSGEFDREAMQQGIQQVKPLIDSGTAPVHVVWDMSGITRLPKDIREPMKELEIMRYHPNGGWVVMISSNVMVRFVGQIATRFIGANFRSVVSFDEAVETLRRVDGTVADALQHAVLPPPLKL